MQRTLENCTLIQKCVRKGIGGPEQRNGKCMGYQKSENDDEPCEICKSEERFKNIICVVHGPKDVFAFEKMKEFHGVYHVLNGYISPSKGIGYDDINLASLISKIEK